MSLILVVDDEKMMRELLRDMLEIAGYAVLETSDGEKAIELYLQKGPDAVITDILMPNKGGLYLISELKRINPAAKIIAISGGGREGKLNFLNTAKTFPGVMTMKKPCSRNELLATLEKLLRGDSDPASDGCPNARRGGGTTGNTALTAR